MQNWACMHLYGSAPSQETEQVSHIFIHMGLILLAGGSSRLLPCLGLGQVSRPCNLGPKLLWSRACKRDGTLPLLWGWPPAGEPNAVDNALCPVTLRDRPAEVVAVHLRPDVHHPAPT